MQKVLDVDFKWEEWEYDNKIIHKCGEQKIGVADMVGFDLE